jgi:hypothetical protein
MWQDTVDWIVRNRIVIGFWLIGLTIILFERFSTFEGPDTLPKGTLGKVTGYRHTRESRTRFPLKRYLKAEFQINGGTQLYSVTLDDTSRFGMGDSIFRIGDTLFFADSSAQYQTKVKIKKYH